MNCINRIRNISGAYPWAILSNRHFFTVNVLHLTRKLTKISTILSSHIPGIMARVFRWFVGNWNGRVVCTFNDNGINHQSVCQGLCERGRCSRFYSISSAIYRKSRLSHKTGKGGFGQFDWIDYFFRENAPGILRLLNANSYRKPGNQSSQHNAKYQAE